MRSMVLVSGGLDSVVLSHFLAQSSDDLLLFTVNYGQRNVREFEFAAETAKRLNATHQRIDVPNLADANPGRSLTDSRVNVPAPGFEALYPELHGGDVPPPVDPAHLNDRVGAVNMVPNRNVILLAIAFARAVSWEADQLAFAALAGSAITTPDTSPEFVSAFNVMEGAALRGYLRNLVVTAPFIGYMKRDVVRAGHELGVPMDRSWSCFNNLSKHCGGCHACSDRRAAFIQAGIQDETEYLS